MPSHTQQEDTRPLSNITVVSLEQAIAGPYCTRQLADLGARVIKVERPITGDFSRQYDTRVQGLSSHFVWVNRNKESIALDLKNSQDLAVLFRLVEKADVLVQNLAPGAAARMGLSYDALREEYPSLIVCDISGYGQDGPYKNKKAYDLLIQSEAGLLAVTGTKTEPVKAGISVADIAAGMYAYTNILSALISRAKTGKGRRIDISMLECMAEWMGFPLYYAFNKAPRPVPNGASHASIYPYGPFEVAEGESVMLGIQNEREWTAFCKQVLQLPSLATDERFNTNAQRVANSEALGSIIKQHFSELSAAEVIQRLDAAAIANAKVNTLQDVWEHPQFQARGRWSEMDTPNGRVPALIPPGCEDASEARMDPVPSVGEHSEQIRAELGL
ncbi:CoA-transferase family III [Sarocladium strictum]